MSASFYIDIKYASMLSSRVRNFKRQNDKTYNFSCVYCGDSSKSKTKARGYIYAKKGTLLYRCHNCNVGTTFSKLLEYIDTNLYAEYTLEKYKANCTHNHTPKFVFPASTPLVITEKKTSPLDELKKISDLSEDHPAVSYIQSRLIPNQHWDILYFCPKYVEWTSKHHKKISVEIDIPRLVIPHFNQNNDLIGWAGRAFGNEKLRYHNVKLGEDQLLYGLERVDTSKTIYVTEGQIDSLLIDNCIAASGVSAFDSLFMKEHKENIVLIIDNEPRNPHIVKAVDTYINKGYSIVLFPDYIDGKDINLMIQAGSTKQEVEDLITAHTVKDMSAKLKLTQWSKV